MGGMDDLNFEELVDGALNVSPEGDALSDEDETAKFEMKKLLRPKKRGPLKTPVLSGEKMASDTHGGFPAMDDETVETLASTKQMSSQKLKNPDKDVVKDFSAERLAFGNIYKREGLPNGEDSFTVFRLEALYNDEEIAELADSARAAAVRAILKSHDVPLDDVFDDAVARRDALDSYDERLKTRISQTEKNIREENSRLEREIEEYAAPRLEKMEKNNERLEAMRRSYRDWFERKQTEQARITEIVEPWGGDERLRVTEKVTSISEPAETRPNPAVSEDDVFDGAPESAAESTTEDSGGWELGEVPSEGLETTSSVETDLPSETESAPPTSDASITGEIEIQPQLRLPVTPLQGLVAAIGIVLWLAAGMLIPAQLDGMKAPIAIAVGFGAPVLVALIVSSATRSGGRWSTGFFSVLLYASVIGLLAAHLARPAVFVKSLTQRPVWYIDEAGLSADFEATFHRAWGPYGEFVGAQFGVETSSTAPPTAEAPQ